MNDLLEEFREFISKFQLVEEKISDPAFSPDFTFIDQSMRLDDWWFDPKHPFWDFTKCIVDPGTNESYPEGAIGVRGDDNFWSIAVFPDKFKPLTIQEIVTIVWPDKLDKAEFLEDFNEERIKQR